MARRVIRDGLSRGDNFLAGFGLKANAFTLASAALGSTEARRRWLRETPKQIRFGIKLVGAALVPGGKTRKTVSVVRAALH